MLLSSKPRRSRILKVTTKTVVLAALIFSSNVTLPVFPSFCGDRCFINVHAFSSISLRVHPRIRQAFNRPSSHQMVSGIKEGNKILNKLNDAKNEKSENKKAVVSQSRETSPLPFVREGHLMQSEETSDRRISRGLEAANPSEAFGAPLTKSQKEFSGSAVATLKSYLFDVLFSGKDREYARFYALETIARMPYFSYLSVLHFYETIGWWRKANYLKLHFAESWNELHHLLIMEALGGSDKWQDRFVAQHIAVAYYWLVVGLYFINPTLAYHLNQHVEEHAYATYDTFLKDKKEYLQQQPAPKVAIEYYTSNDGNDLYMFDEFHSSTVENCFPSRRRPVINNLYDVFLAIRDDELEHVKTMSALQYNISVTSLNEDDEGCEVPPQFYMI